MKTTATRADVVVIALCLCLALLLFWMPYLRQSAGAFLVVTYQDGHTERHTLATDATLHLTGKDGHTLTVVIENGRARVSESSCPDGLCRLGAIDARGETLICLPAGIALTVKGTQERGESDAVIG